MYLQHYKYLWSEVKVVHIIVAESVYTNLYDWVSLCVSVCLSVQSWVAVTAKILFGKRMNVIDFIHLFQNSNPS